MNEREQLDMMRQIARIRALQFEQSRNEAQRLARIHEEAKAFEAEASSRFDAQLDGMRRMLAAGNGVSLTLVASWDAAIASARTALASAAVHTREAERNAELHRKVVATHHRQADLSEELVERAARRYTRACDDRQTFMIEDLFRSREARQ
ncbi:hypothetical protein ACAX43_21110 [Paraburkholderia sp. IW21]|uniref:hypothetical protein n=1 Tax=Paraburkholderia sp. IW21 TaxID=3242488 RepID=UPI0035201890